MLRVLVVDDDPLSFRTSCRLLRSRFDVRGALDAEDALAILESGAEFDAVLLDVKLPTISGVEVYRRFASAAPERASSIVFMTGDEHLAEVVPIALGRRCLRKPITAGDLFAAISGVCAHAI